MASKAINYREEIISLTPEQRRTQLELIELALRLLLKRRIGAKLPIHTETVGDVELVRLRPSVESESGLPTYGLKPKLERKH